jgi:cation transporter-like permease
MWGIIILIPFALSIPVGAFLLRKYYGHRKEAIPAALIVLVFEGMIISGISWFVYGNH